MLMSGKTIYFANESASELEAHECGFISALNPQDLTHEIALGNTLFEGNSGFGFKSK